MSLGFGGAVIAFVAALGLGGANADPARSELLQRFAWSRDEAAFGGFSGIDLADDGVHFVAVSDRTTIWRGKILRGAAGQIIGVSTSGPVTLQDSKGRPLGRQSGDSEGVAIAADGRVFVSFEGVARVAAYARDAGPARTLPRPAAFKALRLNAALEALAVDAAGALYTLPERSGSGATPVPVWRFRDGAWRQPFAVPRDGDWLPVGADFGPDGRLYLLERDFWGPLGFLSRVRVFDVSDTAITGGTVLLQTPAGRHDNLEGLAVWQDGTGAIRLTMIADDNFSLFQHTEIVEYRLIR